MPRAGRSHVQPLRAFFKILEPGHALGKNRGLGLHHSWGVGTAFPDLRECQPLLSTHHNLLCLSAWVSARNPNANTHPPSLHRRQKLHTFLGEENIPTATRTKQKVIPPQITCHRPGGLAGFRRRDWSAWSRVGLLLLPHRGLGSGRCHCSRPSTA